MGPALLCQGWELQGYFAVGVGRCKDIPRLGTAGIHCSWPPRILCGWALLGYWDILQLDGAVGNFVVGHCVESQENLDVFKSNNPTVNVGIMDKGTMFMT